MSSNEENDANGEAPYAVGYGKPPVQHRFKPGQSGNRKGRPKKAQSLEVLLDEALNTRIDIKERGQLKRIRVKDAIVKRIVAGAVSGDHKSIDTLMKMQRSRVRPEPIDFEADLDMDWDSHVQRLQAARDEGRDDDKENQQTDEDGTHDDDASS